VVTTILRGGHSLFLEFYDTNIWDIIRVVNLRGYLGHGAPHEVNLRGFLGHGAPHEVNLREILGHAGETRGI